MGRIAMRRRKFLNLVGSAAALGILPNVRPLLAQDKPDEIVYMTWGGIWGNLYRTEVNPSFEEEHGVRVTLDLGSGPVERITKLKAGIDNQRYDLVQLHDGLLPLAYEQGVLEPIDHDSPRLTNLSNIMPQFVHSHWVTNTYTAVGVTYNTAEVDNPPTSFADLWREEFRGRIVLPEVAHSIGTYIIPIGAIAQGRDPKDIETGTEMLRRMNELDPIWALDTDTIQNAFRSGEALIGLLYPSQTMTVQGWGAPVEWVYPSEGAISLSWGMGIVKGTRRKEWAERYMNHVLAPEMQLPFSHAFNYPGTNRRAMELLPEDMQAKLSFTDDEMDRMIELDHAFMNEKRDELTQIWNRIVAG